MISEWSISNFKSISEPITLPLSPLTIICGPNSSGKSTIIQSLLVFAQTIKSPSKSNALTLNGSFTRLGNIADVIHNGGRYSKNIQLSCTIEASSKREPFNQILIEANVSMEEKDDETRSVLENYNLSTSVQTTGDNAKTYRLISTRKSKDSKRHFIEKHQNIHDDHNLPGDLSIYSLIMKGLLPANIEIRFDSNLRRVHEELDLFVEILYNPKTQRLSTHTNDTLVSSVCSEILQKVAETFNRPHDRNRTNRMYDVVKLIIESIHEQILTWVMLSEIVSSKSWRPLQINTEARSKIISSNRWLPTIYEEDFSRVAQRFAGITSEYVIERKNRPSEAIRIESRALSQHLLVIHQTVSETFTENFWYLGPLRDDPKVIYSAPDDVEKKYVGNKGQFTAAILAEYGQQVIDYPIPRENGLGLELGKATLLEATTIWLRYMDLVSDVISKERSKIGFELNVQSQGVQSPLDLMNVGVGVSQVLPTIVMSLISPRDAILILEQPELHLHPKVQSMLGDFFIGIATLGKQCILETHSERIIDRIRRRIAEESTDRIRSLTQIYFIEKSQATSRITNVKPNEYGAIPDWPKGFFDEGPDESICITQAATRKQLAKFAKR